MATIVDWGGDFKCKFLDQMSLEVATECIIHLATLHVQPRVVKKVPKTTEKLDFWHPQNLHTLKICIYTGKTAKASNVYFRFWIHISTLALS